MVVKTPKKRKVTKTKKQSIDTAMLKKFSREAPYELHFVLADGKRIKTILELATLLEDIDNDIFAFHVNPEKNDFVNWIENVFEEKDLAEDLKNIREKIELQNSLLNKLLK